MTVLVAVLTASLALVTGGTIPTVTLNNGVDMPRIAFGTGTPGKGDFNSSMAEAAVKMALSLGITHIDTAHMYKNQDGVGRALAALPRKSFFLTTKVERASSAKDAYAFTAGRMEEDLDSLNMSFVDLMMLHYPPSSNDCETERAQWRALEDFYHAGKARAIGVSNYCVSSFECILGNATIVPMVNQIEYHVGLAAEAAALEAYSHSKGIHIQAYSPLASDKSASSLITGNLTNGIGQSHNKSGAQVALRWIIQTGASYAVASSSKAHLLQDLDVVDWSLTSADMQILNAATKPEGQHWSPCSKSFVVA